MFQNAGFTVEGGFTLALSQEAAEESPLKESLPPTQPCDSGPEASELPQPKWSPEPFPPTQPDKPEPFPPREAADDSWDEAARASEARDADIVSMATPESVHQIRGGQPRIGRRGHAARGHV
jgi:hypothetical protein